MTLVPAILARALQLHRAGNISGAAGLYQEVLQAEPRHANALHLLGLTYQHGGDAAHALECFNQAISVEPAVAAFRLNRGGVLRALGRAAEALADFHVAQQLEPHVAAGHHQAGNALKHLGRFAEAIGPLRTAAQLSPRDAAIWLNLGAAYLELHETEKAIAAFRTGVALEPSRPEAHNILGHALALQGEFQPAEAAFLQALCLRPGYAAAHDNLGGLCKAQARIPEAIAHYRAALASEPAPATHSNLLLALNFSATIPAEEVFAEHCRWGALHAAAGRGTVRPVRARDAAAGRRLRLGYVSPDFINHAVARFIEPVLAAHDRSCFEVFCYSSTATPDNCTTRLRGASEHWRDTARLDAGRVAQLIRDDRIDMLVDLAGHTAENQLLVFARQPAPVQITWIGYPNTTGLKEMDYRLTDAVADPPGVSDQLHREQLVRLPGPFSCYLPSRESPEVSPLPALATGHVTFGSFNQFAKLGPAVVELWVQLLRACPSAHLLLRARSLADAATAARLRTTFGAAGVDPDRLQLDGTQLSIRDHQGRYDRVDVALDPFPYNGTTTTCEALWMGVPVITLAGRTHVARVGASLLTHLGAPEWIASSPDDYLARAMALAADLPQLASIRAALRARFRACPLADAAQFTRGLEATYSRLWTAPRTVA